MESLLGTLVIFGMLSGLLVVWYRLGIITGRRRAAESVREYLRWWWALERPYQPTTYPPMDDLMAVAKGEIVRRGDSWGPR